MVWLGAYRYGFICGATMIRLYRVVGLLAISVAISNCAGPSTWLTSAQLQAAPTRVSRADDAFWSTQPEPVGRRHHHPQADVARGPSPAGSAPHVTTGSAPRDSQASIDATNRAKPTLDGSNTAKPAPHRWFGPEWQAE